MKIELELKVDGKRFFYDSAEMFQTMGPDGKWSAREPLTPQAAYDCMCSMFEKLKGKFRCLIEKSNELENMRQSATTERNGNMETTRYVVEYNIPASPASRLITPVISMIMDSFPFFMKVDAVCAKDAVEAVLAARPNASIVAVRAQKTDCEKKDEA